MSTADWKDLERLWQSDVPAAAPALDVIAKQRRRRWAWQLTVVTEILMTIAGTGFCIWVMTSATPYTLVLGGGALAVTLFAAGSSLWARSLRRAPAPEESVLAALEVALHRARVSVRWGLASFWVMVPFLAFVALMAFLWAGAPEYPLAATRRILISLGVWAAWGASCQAVAIVYYVRRARELARLENLKRELGDEL